MSLRTTHGMPSVCCWSNIYPSPFPMVFYTIRISVYWVYSWLYIGLFSLINVVPLCFLCRSRGGRLRSCPLVSSFPSLACLYALSPSMVPRGNIECQRVCMVVLGEASLSVATYVFIGFLGSSLFPCRFSVGLVPLGVSHTEGTLNGTGLTLGYDRILSFLSCIFFPIYA